jgi:hypothetical protein
LFHRFKHKFILLTKLKSLSNLFRLNKTLGVFLVAILTFVYASEPDPWWNSRYGFRQRVSIQNESTTDSLSTEYSVKVLFDHSTVGALASGNDVRMVYWNGSEFVEIDRVNESSWRSGSTEIWFKTQADISASGYDNHYYLYYNNIAAESPPADRSTVYLWYDDFSTDTLSNYYTGRFVDFADDQVGDVTYNAGDISFVNGDKQDGGILIPSIEESNLLISCNVNLISERGDTKGSTFGLGLRWTSSTNANYGFYRSATTTNSPGIHDTTSGELKNNVGSIANESTTQLAVATDYFFMYAAYNDQHRLWKDTNDTSSANLNGTGFLQTTGNPFVQSGEQTGTLDNLLVRKYFEPEPTITLGSEEELSDYKVVATQPFTAGVSQAEGNVVILRLDIATAVSDNITEITVSSNNVGDNDVTGVSCYYGGTSMNFETTAPFGFSDNVLSGNLVTFTDSRVLPDYSLVHFFITYNVASNATSGNTLDASIIANSVTISSNTFSANLGLNPTGSRTISANADLGSINLSNSNTTDVVQGSSNQEVLRIDIPVSGAGSALTLTNLIITGNNTNFSDIDTASCFYTSTSTVFSTNTSFGSPNQAFTNGEVAFSGVLDMDVPNTSDNNHYLFIAYNLNSLAIDGATVDGYMAGANITIEGDNHSAVANDPNGSRLIYIPTGKVFNLPPSTFEIFSNPSYDSKKLVIKNNTPITGGNVDSLETDDGTTYAGFDFKPKALHDPQQFWTTFIWDLSSYQITGSDINSLSFNAELYMTGKADTLNNTVAPIDRLDEAKVQLYNSGSSTWEDLGTDFSQAYPSGWDGSSDAINVWNGPDTSSTNNMLSYSKTSAWTDNYLNNDLELKIRVFINGLLTASNKSVTMLFDTALIDFNYGSLFQQTSFRWADESEAPIGNENETFTASTNQQLHLRTGLRITRKAKGTHYLALQYDTVSTFTNPILLTTNSTNNLAMWNDTNHIEGDSVEGAKSLSGSPSDGTYHEDHKAPSQTKAADTIYEEDFTVHGLVDGTYYLRVVEVDDQGAFSATLDSYTSETKLIVAAPSDNITTYNWAVDTGTPIWSGNNIAVEFVASTNYLVAFHIDHALANSNYTWQLQYQENPYTSPGSWTNVSITSNKWKAVGTGVSPYILANNATITLPGEAACTIGTLAFNGVVSETGSILHNITTNSVYTEIWYSISAESTTQNNAYRFRLTNSGSASGISHIKYPVAKNSTFEQVSFRWADDTEAPIETENTGGNVAVGTNLHLRVALRANHTTISDNYIGLLVDGDNDGDFNTGGNYLLSSNSANIQSWTDADHTDGDTLTGTKLLSSVTADGVYHYGGNHSQTKTLDTIYEEDFTIVTTATNNYYLKVVTVDSSGANPTALDTYSQAISLTASAPSLTQQCFRWASDNTVLSFSSSDNTNLEFSIGTKYILAIQMENGPASTESPTWQLQYQKTNGTPGSWTSVTTTSTDWKAVNGVYDVGPNSVNTTNFVCNSGNASTLTYLAENGVYSETGSLSKSISASKYTEYWFAVEATINANNNSYRFRLTDNGSAAIFKFSSYPLAAKAYTEQVSYRWADDTGAALYNENASASIAVDANLHLRVGIRSNNGALGTHYLGLQAATDITFTNAWLVTETSDNVLMWNGGSDGLSMSASKILNSSPLAGIYHTNVLIPTAQIKVTDNLYEEDFSVSANVVGSYYLRVVSVDSTGANPIVLDVYSNIISMSASLTSLEQSGFEWATDQVGPDFITGSDNTALTYTVNSNYILAFRFENSGVIPTDIIDWKVQYQKDPLGSAGSWTDITTTSIDWKMIDGDTAADQDVIIVSASGNALSPASSGNNQNGVYAENNDTGAQKAIPDKAFTEFWYAIQPQSSTSRASYRFRLTDSGSAAGITFTRYGWADAAAIINSTSPLPLRGVIFFNGAAY